MKKKKSVFLFLIMCMLMMFVLTGCCRGHEFTTATCTENSVCKNCGKVNEKAKGHDLTEADCTNPPTCRRCGESFGTALGHDFSKATCTQDEICSRCGEHGEAAKGHKFTKGSCIEAGKCVRCGEAEGKAPGHDFSEATCTEPSKCKRCGFTKGRALGHDKDEIKCGEDGKCKRCGETIKGPEHKWTKATCEEAETCKKCGETKGEPLGHSFEKGVCTRCNKKNTLLIDISKLAGLKAKAETDVYSCLVDVDSDFPYDVYYDYGDEYNSFVERCDWSLVFDAEYYKKTFPYLALLYHNNDELLLKHFQTVGVHEGRQGSEKFNVGAYYYNCDNEVYKCFNTEDSKNYECYYLYYMLDYENQKSVNTVSAKDKTLKKQYRQIFTYVQKAELKGLNRYRKDIGVDDLTLDEEMCALANYRGYVNQTEGWTAHDWAHEYQSKVLGWVDKMGGKAYGENMIESSGRKVIIGYDKYYASEEHKETLLDSKYKYVGLGNTYTGKKRNDEGHKTYTFDVFFEKANTVMNH